jgi:hypothetical protein
MEKANSRVALVFGGGRVGLMGILADSMEEDPARLRKAAGVPSAQLGV